MFVAGGLRFSHRLAWELAREYLGCVSLWTDLSNREHDDESKYVDYNRYKFNFKIGLDAIVKMQDAVRDPNCIRVYMLTLMLLNAGRMQS